MSFLLPRQHEQYCPEGLSVFAGLDKVSIEIQGLSRCVQALFLSDERGEGGGGGLII